MASETVKDDKLMLGQNQHMQKLLSKIGNNFPKPEKVLLSDTALKINKRNKEQERVIVVTNKALYNMKVKEYNKCQRRIELEKIVSVSDAEDSDEFTLHVPEEYDYRYKTKDKSRIIDVICEAYHAVTKGATTLKVQVMTQAALENKTLTKDAARVQTREQRYERYLELVGRESFDDEVEDAKQARKTVAIMDTKEKVKADDFEFLKVLGRGSFGKVMLVKHKQNNNVYAMKILKKKYIIEKHQVEHTKAERKLLKSLQHPFLMQLRYAFQTESKLYFVLDFYKGGELFFHLKLVKRFSEPQARFLTAEVGMALGHLHSLDTIYRDLKPENILLDSSGHICLTDFGLAKELEGDAMSKTFCGTPEYLAPEVIANAGHGKAVDWWSLGILLYELSVGIPPFYDQNVHSMYAKIQKAPLLIPSALSKPCRDLITQLLHRTPAKRLGAGPGDFGDIQAHGFWKGLDFDKLYKKEIDPPYKPRIKGGAADTTNFDAAFLKQKPADSHTEAPVVKDVFTGFSYMPSQESTALGNR